MPNSESIRVTCPRCQKTAQWKGNDFRPFCSERCKMIDLGAWANDEYKVPTHERPSEITPEYDQD